MNCNNVVDGKEARRKEGGRKKGREGIPIKVPSMIWACSETP